MNERQERILDLVTEQYIGSARPVPSAWVARKLRVSSATVRNEFSLLEEQGYLQQPHTSAGRVPTGLTYLRYARKFIPPQQLPEAERRFLIERLSGLHGDNLFQRIANVAADLSGYAVVVNLPPDDSLLTLQVHLSAISSSRLLAVVVLESGLIRQLVLEVEPVPPEQALREAESDLGQLTLPVREVPVALLDIAKRASEEVARTFFALAQAWHGLNPPRVFSQGLTNLLSEPESTDPNFVRHVVERLERPQPQHDEDEAVAVILEDLLAQVRTRLPLGACRGGLILLGPTRMRYPEVLMVVRGVTETVAGRAQPEEADLN